MLPEMNVITVFLAGIAAAPHVQYFDGEDCQDKYDMKLVRVKDIVVLSLA